ncbi:MAG: AraC family transcriptional regulator [Planctomycetes bacterium]|nr:AraC family transcriptional regulator [Planctomycetota bacterium]
MLDALAQTPVRQSGARVLFDTRPVALHAMISSAGLCRETTTAYDWHGIRRGSAEFVLLQYTLAGRGRLTYEGKEHVVLPGQAMLLFFPHDNRYWLPAGESWEFFYLCLHGREVLRAWRQVIARHGPLLAMEPSSPSLQNAAQACAEVLAGKVANQFRASALAYALAMQLLSEFAGDPSPQRRVPGIARAKEVVRARYAENIGVEDLARAAGFSRYHFSRLFTVQEGVTPAAYIVQQRLRAALRLLRDGDAPVGEVAIRCGFSDATYFCRVFRKAMGLSPGEFRHSGMY